MEHRFARKRAAFPAIVQPEPLAGVVADPFFDVARERLGIFADGRGRVGILAEGDRGFANNSNFISNPDVVHRQYRASRPACQNRHERIGGGRLTEEVDKDAAFIKILVN